jgi:hypothetical protein
MTGSAIQAWQARQRHERLGAGLHAVVPFCRAWRDDLPSCRFQGMIERMTLPTSTIALCRKGRQGACNSEDMHRSASAAVLAAGRVSFSRFSFFSIIRISQGR